MNDKINDDASLCYYEPVGTTGLHGARIYETSCDNEHVGRVPATCSHCSKAIVIAFNCRRCGADDHTTMWHDAQDSQALRPGTAGVELNTISAADLFSWVKSKTGDKI